MKIYAIVARMILVAVFSLFTQQVLAVYDNGILITSPLDGEDVARGGILEIQYRITRPIPPGTDIVFRLMRGSVFRTNIDYEEFGSITHKLPARDSTSINEPLSVRLPLPADLPLTAPPFQNIPYHIVADLEDPPWWIARDRGVDRPRFYFGKSSNFNIVPLTTMWLGEANGIRVTKPAGEESFVPGGTMTVRYEYERGFLHSSNIVRIHLLETTGWGEPHPSTTFFSETRNVSSAETDIVMRIPEDISERRENGYAINVSARSSRTGEWLYGISAAFSIQQPMLTFTESDPDYTNFIGKARPGKEKVVGKTELVVLQPGNRNEHYDMYSRLANIPFRWRFYPGSDNVIPARWEIELLRPSGSTNALDLEGPYSPYISIYPNHYIPYATLDPNHPGLQVTKGIEKERTFYEYTYTWDPSGYRDLLGHYKFRVSGLDFSAESQKHFTLGHDFDLIAGPIYTEETDNTLKIDVGLKGMPLPNGPIDFLVELMPDLDYALRYDGLYSRNKDEWWQALDSWQITRSVANSGLYNWREELEIETIDLGTQPLNSPIIQALAEEKESCGVYYRVTVDSSDRVPEQRTTARTKNTNYGHVFLELRDGAIKLTGSDVDGNTISGGSFSLYIHNCGKLRAVGTLRVRQKGCWGDDTPGSLHAWGVCQDHDYVDLFERTTDLPPSTHMVWGDGYISKSPYYDDYTKYIPLLHREHFEGTIEITFEGDFASWIPEDQNPMLINYVLR